MKWEDVAMWIGAASFFGMGVLRSEPWLLAAGLMIAGLEYIIFKKDQQIAELRSD